MAVREIPAARWRDFLEVFSRGHRSWLATVDRQSPGAPPRTEIVERPLGSVTPEMSAQRIVGIEIRFQEGSEPREAVRIDAPARVRVDETEKGAARGLEIQDEHGAWTRIRFRTAPLPEMLDGVTPGELAQN